ncbi:hypothetical protein [Chryseobacterium sp.]|uniref:hypothetical protein n=1 Tax=Chryseobacterium sp. TaxID=1871047 RepID=UPI00388D3563
MQRILTGLFERNSDYKRLEFDLENSGIDNSQYIVYLENGENHTHYMASVEVNDEQNTAKLQNIFAQNSVIKMFIFNDLDIQKATYDNVKKLISVKCKSEIQNSPNLKKKEMHFGINSEVKA